jgi:hypothetical protein
MILLNRKIYKACEDEEILKDIPGWWVRVKDSEFIMVELPESRWGYPMVYTSRLDSKRGKNGYPMLPPRVFLNDLVKVFVDTNEVLGEHKFRKATSEEVLLLGVK